MRFLFAPVVLIIAFSAACETDLPLYPDDAYSRPREDHWRAFETLCGAGIAGDTIQRAQNFHHYDLVLEPAPAGVQARWTFKRKAGMTAGTVLMFYDTLRRRPESISFHVHNGSAVSVPMMISVSEMSWQAGREARVRDWLIMTDHAIAPGAEETVCFPIANAKAAKNPEEGGAIVFPARFALHIPVTAEETEYDLRLSDLTVHYPAAPITATLKLPAKAVAGKPVTMEIVAPAARRQLASDIHEPPGRWRYDISIEWRKANAVVWRVRLTEIERDGLLRAGRVDIRRDAPWFLPCGKLTAVVVVDGYQTDGVDACVVENAIVPSLPKVERKEYHGRPAAFVNGAPLAWSGYATYDFQPGNAAEFGASGANVFVIATDAGRHIHQVAAPTLIAPGVHDYAEFDERVAMALQANPEAFIVPRVSLALPPFWMQEHPEARALIRTEDGDLPWEETSTVACSLASRAWLDQQDEELRDFICHCKQQPWAKRIIAFMPTGEVTEEWFAWGANDGKYADYSAVNADAFANWCNSRGIANTTLPAPDDRKKPGWDYYAPDDAGKGAAAYAQYASDKAAEVIAHFARVIKKETRGRCLVGTFYGYVIQLAGEPRQHLAGQFALRQLIDNPDLDFFAGIPLHNFRVLGQGYDTYVSATESILRAGKMYLNENDLFSWLHNLIWYTEYDPADPRGGAITMHRRVLADDIIHGTCRQWFSLLANWHHDAALQDEFKWQIGLNKAALQYDRAPAEEIAYVVDDTTFAWMPPESHLARAANADMMFAFAKTGAPLGVWLLSDLDRLPNRIKVVVVANAVAAREADIEKLRRLINRGGKTVVVTGPTGLINPATQQWDADNTRRLTGMPISIETESGSGKIQTVKDDHIVANLEPLCPRAVLNEPGFLKYTDGKACAQERPLKRGGRLVWVGAPIQDTALARQWVERAGVHCYAPIGCTVYASRGLVSVTATDAGDKLLEWPRAVKVVDLFSGWSAQGAEIPCPFAVGQTRLFMVK